MPDKKEMETLALGLIIAAILYLLIRREFERATGGSGGCSCGGGSGASAGGGGVAAAVSSGNGSVCGKCFDGCSAGATVTAAPAPGGQAVIPLGASSLSAETGYTAAGPGYSPCPYGICQQEKGTGLGAFQAG